MCIFHLHSEEMLISLYLANTLTRHLVRKFVMMLKDSEKKPSIFAEWAGATTAHGFVDFSQARTIIGKAIWFILIFVSLFLMCYQLQRGISDYALHEWKTSIEEKRSSGGGIL